MLTFFSFLTTLAVLITVHEFGHFQVAKWCGIKVLRFSIGFGKPLFKRMIGKDKTEFVIAILPFGGYVKMLDEREMTDEEREVLNPFDLEHAFNRQSVWKRMAVVMAGPIANLLLAVLLYCALFISGITGLKPILGEVVEGSPAALANLRKGDSITKVDGTTVQTWSDVHWIMLKKTMGSSFVDIETTHDDKEVHLHHVLLNGLDKNDLEGDFISKLGFKPFQPEMIAKVGEVVSGSAADKAGIKIGDIILSVDDLAINHWENFVAAVRQNPGKDLNLKILRGDSQISLNIIPECTIEDGKKVGHIGAAYHVNESEINNMLINIKYDPLSAFSKAIEKTWDTSIFSLQMLGKMLMGTTSLKGISGPVTIASYAGQSANLGFKPFVGFLALISISLGVLNLLPVPVLDGGHLLYYIVEILMGRPVSVKTMEIGQRIGLTLLGFLMVCALYNDINRLITG